MARLVVVSNRVPNPADIAAPLAGGLVVALAEALVPGSLWFGWSGRVVENATNQPRSTEAHGITYATIDLEEAAYRDFYLGFSNGTLWPLFHMITGFTVFERSQYAVYHRVNERYAEALVPLLQPDDMIWIHDYQLLSVAAALRERGVTNRIGFFLHIPFPAPALFEILPPALELLENMLAHDVIGFQTVRDKAHFLDAVPAFRRGDGSILLFTHGTAQISVNGQMLGTVTDPIFARVILATFIGHAPPTDRVKRELLGED